MSLFRKISLCFYIVAAFSAVIPSHASVVIDPPSPAGLPDIGATAPLVSVAYSPDGSLLYTLGTTGELIARTIQSKRTVFRDNVGGDATKIRVLSDGSLLIGRSDGDVSWYEKPLPGKLLVQCGSFPSPKTKTPLVDPHNKKSFSFSSEMEDFEASPDGSLLAIATTRITWKTGYMQRRIAARDALLQVWDMRNQKIVHSWEPIPLAILPKYHRSWDALHLAWENDGKALDVAMPDVAVQRFNPLTGELQSEWKPPAKEALQADPATRDAEMKRRFAKLPPGLREKAQQAYERKKTTNPEKPTEPDFGQTQAISLDGRWLLAASPQGWQLWNTASNAAIPLEHTERLAPGNQVAFSNSMLAICAGSRFWAWQLDGKQIGWAQIPSAHFSGLIFSPRGPYLTVGDDTGTARQWKMASPFVKTANAVFPGFFDPWRHLRVAPDLMLAATDHLAATLDAKGHPHWFDQIPIQAPQQLSTSEREIVHVNINDLAVAADGKNWAESVYFEPYSSTMEMKGFPGGELRIRDAKTGQILWRQADKGPFHTLNALRFLMDGTLLLGGRARGRSAIPLSDSFGGLEAREGRSGKPVSLDITWEEKSGYRQPDNIETLLASQDGRRLVISSGSGREGIQVVDLATKKIVVTFGANTTVEKGIWALSPNGKWLGVATEDHIDLWNLDELSSHDISRRTSRSRRTVRLPITSPAQAFSFGKDGRMAAGLQDGRILLWTLNPTDGNAPVWQLWQTMPGSAISALQFSTDGKTLWSGDERGDLKARNVSNGQWESTLRLLPPAAEDDVPSWVRWTRDGKIEHAPS